MICIPNFEICRDFLQITNAVIRLENGCYFESGYNEADLLYTSLAKLSAISDNMMNINRADKRRKRNSCKKEEEEEISYAASSSMLENLGKLYEEDFY